MSYWKSINPGGAVSDLIVVFRDAGPKRWPIALVSAAITVGVFSSLTYESWKIPRAKPTIVFIDSWPEDRTPAETAAFIKANQKAKDEQAARIEAYEAEGRKLWATVGKASGLDVDRAAEKAKQKAETDALMGQVKVEPLGQ
jgi:voltage-gated potassium channel Kch